MLFYIFVMSLSTKCSADDGNQICALNNEHQSWSIAINLCERSRALKRKLDILILNVILPYNGFVTLGKILQCSYPSAQCMAGIVNVSYTARKQSDKLAAAGVQR